MIFFALIWGGMTLLFDVMTARDFLLRLASQRFQPVSCTILESKVVEHSDSDGTSYEAKISFSYSVDGRVFEAHRVYAGSGDSAGRGRARGLVDLFPVGSQAMAYYNPSDPEDAVLRKGFSGDELFHLLFMTPFNLVAVGLWVWIMHARRFAKHPPLAGGAKIIETKEGKRVRLPTIRPIFAAAIAFGGVCFISAFVVALKDEYMSVPYISLVWAAAFGAAVWAWRWRRRRESSGSEDMVLLADGKSVTLPQTCGRKSSVTIDRDNIAGLDVSLVFDSYKRPSQFVPTLIMRNGERLQLVSWADEDRASRFSDWLRGELQLPPPKISTPSN